MKKRIIVLLCITTLGLISLGKSQSDSSPLFDVKKSQQ